MTGLDETRVLILTPLPISSLAPLTQRINGRPFITTDECTVALRIRAYHRHMGLQMAE